MIVKLWVNWRERKVLTTQQLDELIDERIANIVNDECSFSNELEDYLDSYYTKLELFDILSSDSATIKKELEDIREGVKGKIGDWCERNIRDDYEEMPIEV